MSRKPHVRRQPTERDLEIWKTVSQDLLDWLYTGTTGQFQIAGHECIDRWTSHRTNPVVLEIGCGHGHHLRYTRCRHTRYIGLDIESDYLCTVRERFPGTKVTVGEASALPFQSGSVDVVLSVYLFEHLRNLPAGLEEIRRVLKPDGELLIGLPAEGGLLYGLGRRVTSRRYMERKYGIDYDAIVHWEHWNTFDQVVQAVQAQFEIVQRQWIPFPFLPTLHLNVIGCLRAIPLGSPRLSLSAGRSD